MFRHRVNGTINILGLASAFSFVLLIAAFAWNEARVDSTIKNVERQYLVQSDFNQLTTSGMLVRAMREEYPDLVEDYFRYDGIMAILSSGSDSFQKSAIIADSSLFRMFGFELLHGDARTALSAPTQVVLNYETAIQLFGYTDVVGQHINVDQSIHCFLYHAHAGYSGRSARETDKKTHPAAYPRRSARGHGCHIGTIGYFSSGKSGWFGQKNALHTEYHRMLYPTDGLH